VHNSPVEADPQNNCAALCVTSSLTTSQAMPGVSSSLQRITFHTKFFRPTQSARPSVWWGPVWRGLFVDPAGKHYRVMEKALWLYGYLIVHADRKTGTLYRRVSTIALDMQVSERTVQAWLSLLRRHGYIRARTTGRALSIGIEKWRPIVKGARPSALPL
jgi:hypothetical protein